ncbi:MAG: hypothetical protein WBW25_02950 [Halobacteriota archaeon]
MMVPTGSISVLAVPAGTVTATIGNTTGQVTSISGGTASIAVSFTSAQTNGLTAGSTQTLTVSFAGYGNYEPSVATFQITVQ